MKKLITLILISIVATSCGVSNDSSESQGPAAAVITYESETINISDDQVQELVAGYEDYIKSFEGEDALELTEDEEQNRKGQIAAAMLDSLIFSEIFDIELSNRDHEVTDQEKSESETEFRELLETQNEQVQNPEDRIDADEFLSSTNPYLVSVTQGREKIYALRNIIELDTESFPCSYHILFGTDELTDEEAKAKADDAYERAVAGEDFEELAKELSTGPSGPTGGSLGCSDPASFVPPFAAALENPTIDEIIEPVQTNFGWHVITVKEETEEQKEQRESIDEETQKQIDAQRAQQAISELIQDLLKEVKVEVNETYGTWNAEAGRVDPPIITSAPEVEFQESTPEATIASENAESSESTDTSLPQD